MAVQTVEPREYQSVSLRQLWFSLGTGAVLWSVHLVASYAIVGLACERGLLLHVVWQGMSVVRWVLLIFTLVAAALVLYATVLAYANWRHLSPAEETNGDQPAGRFRFMALTGALLNVLFLVSILLSIGPTLFLPLC
ncbi:MAG: hypothetical protein DCC55_28775 [Chloroflexi bacterium]|nr:MAG: hypothetical protein DCC55_28775 [Chloroflexota bacterium]